MSAQWPSRKRGIRVARESPKLRALCILHDHAVSEPSLAAAKEWEPSTGGFTDWTV